jgi:hypothetical protein
VTRLRIDARIEHQVIADAPRVPILGHLPVELHQKLVLGERALGQDEHVHILLVRQVADEVRDGLLVQVPEEKLRLSSLRGKL